ncbi:MAG: response regulator transcription factor [Streptosporangiaceae bacterium]
MRLVLCDDNRILCEALAAGLEAHGHEVAGIATTAADGVRAVAAHDPDVCLLDLRFHEGLDGLSAARTVRKEHPRTKVLILSVVTEPETVAQALEAGVVGFLRKDQDVGQIADALDVVADGGLVIDARLRRVRKRALPEPRPSGLTPRETEVLHRIVAGQDTVQMVSEMGIAVSTLQTYVKNVLTKLGAHTRLQAAALAIGKGLLDDPPIQPPAPTADSESGTAAERWPPQSGVAQPTAGWGFAEEGR